MANYSEWPGVHCPLREKSARLGLKRALRLMLAAVAGKDIPAYCKLPASHEQVPNVELFAMLPAIFSSPLY